MSRHTEYMEYLRNKPPVGPQPLTDAEMIRLRELQEFRGSGNAEYLEYLRGSVERDKLERKFIDYLIALSQYTGVEPEE